MNLTALICIQGSNAVVPLIVFPFALHALGSTAYAELVFSEAIALFVLAIVTYSFDIVGVSNVVRLRCERPDPDLSGLFSAIFYVRLLLFVVAAACALALYRAFTDGSLVNIALWMLIPLSYVFQSTWLYQGLESNAPVAIFSFVSRTACVALVVALIDRPSDKYLLPGIMGSTYFLGGLGAFAYAKYRYQLRLRRVSWKNLRQLIVEGKEMFLGNISVSLSKDMNVIILGTVGVPAHSLAAYSIAEKLIKSFQAIARPLNQLFFPKTIRAIKDELEPSWRVAKAIFRQTLPQLGVLLLVLCLIVACYFVVGKNISSIASFPNVGEIVQFLTIMVPGVFFGVASFMLGSVGLNYLNCRNYFFRVILIVGLVSVSVCYWFAHSIGAMAAAFCYVSAEVLTALLTVRRYGLTTER